MSLDDVVNKEIVVTGFRVQPSKYDKGTGQVLTLQFEFDGQQHILFTGSGVLKSQCEAYRHKMPFMATIKKINRYYTFT